MASVSWSLPSRDQLTRYMTCGWQYDFDHPYGNHLKPEYRDDAVMEAIWGQRSNDDGNVEYLVKWAAIGEVVSWEPVATFIDLQSPLLDGYQKHRAELLHQAKEEGTAIKPSLLTITSNDTRSESKSDHKRANHDTDEVVPAEQPMREPSSSIIARTGDCNDASDNKVSTSSSAAVTMSSSIKSPHPPVWIEDGVGYYTIEAIWGQRINDDGDTEYLVKWTGYDDATWESPDVFDHTCKSLLDQYRKHRDARLRKQKRMHKNGGKTNKKTKPAADAPSLSLSLSLSANSSDSDTNSSSSSDSSSTDSSSDDSNNKRKVTVKKNKPKNGIKRNDHHHRVRQSISPCHITPVASTISGRNTTASKNASRDAAGNKSGNNVNDNNDDDDVIICTTPPSSIMASSSLSRKRKADIVISFENDNNDDDDFSSDEVVVINKPNRERGHARRRKGIKRARRVEPLVLSSLSSSRVNHSGVAKKDKARPAASVPALISPSSPSPIPIIDDSAHEGDPITLDEDDDDDGMIGEATASSSSSLSLFAPPVVANAIVAPSSNEMVDSCRSVSPSPSPPYGGRGIAHYLLMAMGPVGNDIESNDATIAHASTAASAAAATPSSSSSSSRARSDRDQRNGRMCVIM